MKGWIVILLSLLLLVSGCDSFENQNVKSSEVETTSAPPVLMEALSEEVLEEDAWASLPSGNFSIGARVTKQISPELNQFINQHYDYVMTPILNKSARDAIRGPDLILYRSIQGTWEGFTQFDWEHINDTEMMFEHHQGERILTIWNSWLMNANDLVDPNDPDAMNHWINYYTVTASDQIYEYGYDGLFIDSASHKLWKGAVSGMMPDDYDAEEWYQGRVEGLSFIKSYLPDKLVIFNGLHSSPGAEDSLANTDGGMWEVFAFKPQSGEYKGVDAWLEVMELTARNNSEKAIVLVVKEQPGLDEDIQKRVFVVASYLLVSNENVVLSMTNLAHAETDALLYYPEYTLDLGEPLSDYTFSDDQNYARRHFEKGFVLVNPNADQIITYELDCEYLRVVPVGGGEVSENGDWEGWLEYKPVSGQIELPPLSGMILVRP